MVNKRRGAKKNIYYKTAEEIELMRHSNLLVSKTHAAIVPFMKPGQTTKKLDEIAEQFILDNNAIPGFKGLYGFPSTLCISVNDAVVHGLPGDYEIQEGDIVSIDCGVLANEFYGDSAYTYAIGEIGEPAMKLLTVTKDALYKGIAQAIVGKRMGDVAHAIQAYTEKKHKYGVVRDLIGHGVGRNLHEEPEVPNFGKRGKGIILKEGLAIAIEPMINLGRKDVIQDTDGWTILTKDGTPSAHFEHSVIVKKDKADILSTFEFTEEAIRKNDNLSEVICEYDKSQTK